MTKRLSEAPAPASSPITRDPKTLDLLTHFVTEADFGLRRVDDMLMAATREPITPVALNEIFRIFQDIASVSRRVDAVDILRLSRVTETFLEGPRSGRVPAQDNILDALFEASLVARELLEEIWAATIESRTFIAASALDATVSKLELVQSSFTNDRVDARLTQGEAAARAWPDAKAS